MATTPNFNWSTPDNTGLVKNGALDIRTLGNSIDSSMADLKGGTTGQVLTKASNTDMDFSWVADATGIPATILDAKGDIIAATAADTASRLAVGTNGQVLTADSTAATGLKWATVSSSPTFVGASAYVSGTQSIAANTLTTADFANENFDSDGFHSTSSNTSRMTIPTGKAGKYLVTGTLGVDVTSNFYTRINVNGSAVNGSSYGYYNVTGTGDSNINRTQVSFGAILDLAVGDYVQLQVVHSSSTARNLEAGRFDIGYLGA